MRNITVYSILLSLSMLFPRLGRAQQTAVPLEYTWGATTPQKNQEELTNIIFAALVLVEAYPPDENNLFIWKGDKKVLAGKKFILFLTASDDPLVKKIGGQVPGGISPDTDAFTLAFYDPKKDETDIDAFLLLDKLLHDDNRKERPDGFERTVAALAQEIYGNVQDSLKTKDPKSAPPSTAEDRKKAEITAFQAGIDYLHRLMASPEFKKFTPQMHEKFRAVLQRDEEGLRSWSR